MEISAQAMTEFNCKLLLNEIISGRTAGLSARWAPRSSWKHSRRSTTSWTPFSSLRPLQPTSTTAWSTQPSCCCLETLSDSLRVTTTELLTCLVRRKKKQKKSREALVVFRADIQQVLYRTYILLTLDARSFVFSLPRFFHLHVSYPRKEVVGWI